MCFLILTTAEMVFEILTKMKRWEWRKDRGETWCLLASHRTNVSRGLESPFFRFRYKRWWRDGKKVELNEKRRVKVHIFGLDASVTFLSPIISIREGVGETFISSTYCYLNVCVILKLSCYIVCLFQILIRSTAR